MGKVAKRERSLCPRAPSIHAPLASELAAWPQPHHAPARQLTRQDPHDHRLLPGVEGVVPQLLQGLKHLSRRVCGHRCQSAWL